LGWKVLGRGRHRTAPATSGNRGPGRSTRLLCAVAVLGLLIAAPSGLLAVTEPASAPQADEAQVLRVPAGQSSVKVRWEADVRGQHGEFLVLSGADFDSLRVVARVAASGDGEYGVADLSAAIGARVIQLRYLDPRGRLHVLATQEILVESELRPADLWTATAPQPLLTLDASEQMPTPTGFGFSLSPAVERPASLAIQPPTPPPRAG